MGSMKKEIVVGIFLFLFILAFSGGVLAIDIDACDYVISSPGIYDVTGDISANTSDCIAISSSNVVLDCGGFVLDGNGVIDANGISILDVDNVTVRNCEILEFDFYGVILENVDDSVFENLILDGNGIDSINEMFDQGGLSLISSDGNSFDNIIVRYDWWDNLYMEDSSNNIFTNSLFEFAYNEGIELQLCNDNVFDNVTISAPYYDGLYIADSDRTILRNSFISGADDGGEGGVGIFVEGSSDCLIHNNVFDNAVNADVSLAGTGNSWNISTGGNYWYGFSDSCEDADNNGICDNPYDVSEGGASDFDYMPFDNSEFFSFIRTIEIEFNVSEWDTGSTNFSEFSDDELANLSGVIFINEHGQILFIEDISILGDLILNGNIVISNNSIFINSSELPEFDVPAELTFNGLNFNVPRILRDGVVCSDCTIIGYSNGTLVFSASGFSEYVVEEGYVAPPVNTGGSSGGSSSGGKGPSVCADGYHFEGEERNSRCVPDVEPVISEDAPVENEKIAQDSEIEDNNEKFESVITGDVVGFAGAKDWKVVLGVVVLVLVLVYFVRKKYLNKGVK